MIRQRDYTTPNIEIRDCCLYCGDVQFGDKFTSAECAEVARVWILRYFGGEVPGNIKRLMKQKGVMADLWRIILKADDGKRVWSGYTKEYDEAMVV